ncbi:sigma-54-dependent transcriptional regulator [Algicola sagamiensis]|uniref:sigma-54-dependent transcriptional regulator n=1 Tax=Algicola sagamiensis TaxID=163869 RepID=UPI0003648984|nr:sigma-54 dependent transcriptional regulator [Algicola sagamiensis]
MTTFRILIIDDEPAFCELSALWLRQAGYEVVTANLPEDGKMAFLVQPFDLVLLDLAMPPSFTPKEGLSLLPEFQHVPVIVLTGHAERELALEALSLGAWDFLNKPVDPDMLAVVVNRALQKQSLAKELARVQAQHAKENLGLEGVSNHLQQLRELIQRVGPTDVPVLIAGPSGTGKELVAKAVHQKSRRHAQPFISVHCGAIPNELLESELFGYKKGAFTGADSDKDGLLKMADGGTLYLDEIGEMPLTMQVKLLRVLQEGSYYPVGGRVLERIDVRIVSATHRQLPQMITEGSFREDFYYRIKGVTLQTLALADRKEDIPVLIQSFLSEYENECKYSLSVSQDAKQWFVSQSWRGNVRELRHAVLSVAAICQGQMIRLEDIHFIFPETRLQATESGSMRLDEQIELLEKRLIQEALVMKEGNKSQAAIQLGISRQGLIKKMERLGLS